jgi:hypothetical protein
MTSLTDRRLNALNALVALRVHHDPMVSGSCEFLLAALRPDLTDSECTALLTAITVHWRHYETAVFPGDRANAWADLNQLINGAAHNPTTIRKEAA